MMLPSKMESDEDGYIPSGLLNGADNTLGKNANEICEFYNDNKLVSNVIEKSSRESDVFVDLSEKVERHVAPAVSTASISSKPPVPPAHRVLTIPPGSHLPQLPTDAPRLPPPPTRPYIPRSIQVPNVHPTLYRSTPYSVPVPTMFPLNGRPMFHPQRPIPYHHPGFMPMKLPNTTILSQQAIANHNMYAHTYMTPIHAQMSPMAPSFPGGMMVVSHALPSLMHAMNSFPPQSPVIHNELPQSLMPPPEAKPKISSETRKKLRLEAAAKLKAERDARKAQLRAQKLAEKANKIAIKKKKEAKIGESFNRKFANFSKDMFVIRLKDVDSFNRNNEIWRVDNHVLIQKFCGVPSLRAPARQFQSTNRMSGYDSRATWRLFIINPENVEIDKYGSEVTIHDFPTITVLREAKQLAELKDRAFKEIERSEFNEKLNKFEEKQNSKIEARLRKRLERQQKRNKLRNKNMKLRSSAAKISNNMPSDSFPWNDQNIPEAPYDFTLDENEEEVCRGVVNELLDALDDEEYDEGDSFMSTDEDISFSEEDEDDAGSLISLAHSSDNEDDIRFQLYGEDELPAVALEVVVD